MVRQDKREEFQLVCNHGQKFDQETIVLEKNGSKYNKTDNRDKNVDEKVIDRNER